jgi:hypothetical protein
MRPVEPNIIDDIFEALDRQNAAVDQNGYHVQDLFALNPIEIEMEMAAKWVITQDVSEVFKALLKDFLETHNHGSVAKRI